MVIRCFINLEDEDENCWIWHRNPAAAPTCDHDGTHRFETLQETAAGPRTLLGRVELSGRKATLTTNSRPRFESARAMLEQVKGVKLLSCETESPTHPKRAARIEDIDPNDGPTAADPGEIEAARAFLANYYRQWLDQPVPALGGKTPRQAAKDSRLRPQVAALIRGMPDPASPGVTINAPRQMLLAELGLD